MDEDNKLIALAKSLKLTGNNNTDATLSKRLIVDAMVSGRVIVNLQKKVSAPPKAEELLPGPITAPPVQESAPLIPRFLADPENSLKLAAQSATLANASEKASTFCGQCEKEGCKAAGAETKPEKANAETGDVDTGNNDKAAATTNTDTAETAKPTETLKTEPATQPEATADTTPDATTETGGDIANTNPANTPDSPITTDDIPDINPDKIIPTENITPSTPDNPLTGTTGGINGNIPDSIPASTNVTAASANKGTAAIAAASSVASVAAALSDGDSTASALADTPNTSEYSDYPEDYPETPEPTENTSSLGDSTEPEKTLNTDTTEQATSQTTGQTPDPASPIDTSETTSTTTNTEAVNTKTTDTINNADNSAEAPETLTTGSVDTGSDIDASSIATGAAATAAAAASPLIAKVSSAKGSKITGQLNEKSGKILRKNTGTEGTVRKQQNAIAPNDTNVDTMQDANVVPNSKSTVFTNKFPEHEIGVPKTIPTEKLKDINGKFNFVVKEDGRLVVGRKFKEPGGGHIDLSNGNPVLSAGQVKVVGGEIKFIDNSSGHFQPVGQNAQISAENAFKQLGFDVQNKFIQKQWVPDPKLENGGAWRPIDND